ncbi:MAG: YdcF family protein [Planctomycetia bacterium]|nr:YdcF family protein [Planctomycetia bacterium]
MKPLSRRLKRLGWAALVSGLLCVGLFLARNALLPPVARFLDVSEPPLKSDYALVLGGGSDVRPFVAAGLYKTGWVKQVLLPKVKLSPEAEQGVMASEQETTARVLAARGVPAEAVRLLPGECASTADEAASLALLLDAEPNARVLIVTHTFHTRRARSIFHRALGARAGQVHFIAAPTDGYSADDWWQSDDGFGCYANEYMKLATFRLR